MKVILVSPLSDQLVGGIINWTKAIIDYHKNNSTMVDLLLLNNMNAKPTYDSVSTFGRIRNGLLNYFPIYNNFKKLVGKETYDVVHICSSASLGLIRDILIVREAKKHNVKTALHLHFGRTPKILNTWGWERLLFKYILKRVDVIVVMERASQNALHNSGFSNVVFLPNPLSTEVQGLIKKNKGLIREKRKIVYAGHVDEAKGVFELVKACRNIPNVQLKLLGEVTREGNREKLYELAGDFSEKWLSIPGNQTHENVIREMLTCSIFCLPSYSEGFPNVILESMACGCPIVASSVGAIPEMLEMENGLHYGIIVEPRDVSSLRKAILELLANESLKKGCGENAVDRVNSRYSIGIVWNQLVDIWKNLLK